MGSGGSPVDSLELSEPTPELDVLANPDELDDVPTSVVPADVDEDVPAVCGDASSPQPASTNKPATRGGQTTSKERRTSPAVR